MTGLIDATDIPCMPRDSDAIVWGYIHECMPNLKKIIPLDIGKMIQKYAKWMLEWDQRDNKHGKHATFPSHNVVICGDGTGTDVHCTAILKNILSGDVFESIIFKFIAHNFTVHSYFGFIKYPDFFKTDTKKYWNNLFRYSPDSYAVVTYKSLRNKIYYYHQKNRKEFDLKFDINDGSHFIFVMDFVNKQCNVYINEIDDKYRIYYDRNCPTWGDMSNCLIPAYSHHTSFQTMSQIQVELVSYQLRKN